MFLRMCGSVTLSVCISVLVCGFCRTTPIIFLLLTFIFLGLFIHFRNTFIFFCTSYLEDITITLLYMLHVTDSALQYTMEKEHNYKPNQAGLKLKLFFFFFYFLPGNEITCGCFNY